MPDPTYPPFASASELVTFSGGTISTEDATTAVLGVSRAIRKRCGWHIWPALDETVLVSGVGQVVSLPTLHVQDVESVTVAGTLLDDDTYRWSVLGSLARNDCSWRSQYNDISVAMTHGYDEVDDLKALTLGIAARAMSSKSGVVREQTLVSSITWALTAPGVAGGIALLPHEVSTIDAYRIVSV